MAVMGPSDVAQRRKLAQALIDQSSDASPVQHWTQALSRVTAGGLGGYEMSRANRGEQEGMASGSKALAQALAGGDYTEALSNPYVGDKAWSLKVADRNRAQSLEDEQRKLTQQRADPMYQLRLQQGQEELAASRDARARQRQLDETFTPPAMPSGPSQEASRFAAPGLVGQQPQQQSAVRQLFDQLPPEKQTAVRALWQSGDREGAMKIMTQPAQAPKKSVTELKQIYAADDAIPQLEGTLERLDLAEKLISEAAESGGTAAYEGTGAGWAGYIGSRVPGGDMLFDKNRAKATDEYGSLMNLEAITAMADTLKGATTNFELQEFVRILADPSQPKDIRRRTLKRMRSLAEKQIDLARRRANEIRSGEYYQAPSGSTPRALDVGDGFTVEIE